MVVVLSYNYKNLIQCKNEMQDPTIKKRFSGTRANNFYSC